MEDAGHDQGQVRRRATFRPPSLACLAAHLAGAGDRNLSFVLAPPSVPANLNVYGVRTTRRLADLGPRLRELEIIPDLVQT